MYGSFIASARRARGLTQVQLAEISGIKQANISAIERDRRMPSAATLHRLLHACGFELTATAGARVIGCRPPPNGDVYDALLERSALDEAPIVSFNTPMATRVRMLTAALEASEAVVRST